MAKLYSSLTTDRWGRRGGGWGEQTHRLGDTWVKAAVQNWDHQIEVRLDDDGAVLLEVYDLTHHTTITRIVGSSITEFARFIGQGQELPVAKPKTRRGHRKRKYNVPDEWFQAGA